MIEIMERSHGKALGIRVDGRIDEAAYAPVREAMEELIAEHGRIRVLVLLERLGAIEPRAFWEDLKFGLHHIRDFERMAAVGDQGWLGPYVKVFSPLVPGESRTFPTERAEDAWRWIEEDGGA